MKTVILIPTLQLMFKTQEEVESFIQINGFEVKEIKSKGIQYLIKTE